MIGFWIAAAAMVAMVGLVLLQSLWQAQARQTVLGAAADLAVYRDQLAEVDRDLARGTLSASEADRARLEVQRRMLEVDRAEAGLAPAQASKMMPLAVGVTVLALLGSGGLYWQLGVPGYPDVPLSQRLAAADVAYNSRPSQEAAEAGQPAFVPPANQDPEMAGMLDKLRSALQTRPDDLQGHILLAQNEAALGNFTAARAAQEAVVRIKGPSAGAEDLSLLAYLMVRAAGGLVTPQAEQVVIRLLQIDPQSGWGRFYSGLMFAEIGRPDRTFALWEPLVREGAAEGPWSNSVRDQIGAIAEAAGVNYTLPAAPVGTSAAPGPDADQVAAASQMSEADRTAMVQSMVAGLEERLLAGGGPVEDWVRLITSLGVLKEADRARSAYAAAEAAFVGKPGDLAALKAAAVGAGIVQP